MKSVNRDAYTHLGTVTHEYVSKCPFIGACKDVPPVQCHAITGTHADTFQLNSLKPNSVKLELN